MKYLYVNTVLEEERGMSQGGSVGRKPPSKELRGTAVERLSLLCWSPGGSGFQVDVTWEDRNPWGLSTWNRQWAGKSWINAPESRKEKETGPVQEFLSLKWNAPGTQWMSHHPKMHPVEISKTSKTKNPKNPSPKNGLPMKKQELDWTPVLPARRGF